MDLSETDPYLIDLPAPDLVWAGPEYIVVVYEDMYNLRMIECDDKFHDFEFITGESFLYDKKEQIYIRPAAKCSLWEGPCLILTCHATGAYPDEQLFNDAFQVVSDMSVAVSRGYFPRHYLPSRKI